MEKDVDKFRCEMIEFPAGQNPMRLRSIHVHVDFKPNRTSLRCRCYQYEGKRKIVWGRAIGGNRNIKTVEEAKRQIELAFRGKVRGVVVSYDPLLDRENEMLEFETLTHG